MGLSSEGRARVLTRGWSRLDGLRPAVLGSGVVRASLPALALALLAAAAARAAPGELCRLGGTGDWGPIGSYTGPVSGCADLGPDDSFLIEAGAAVRTVDDLVMDGVTPGLTIQADGAWTLDSADRRGGPGPLRVAVNGNAYVGVVTSPSAVVRVHGRVLEWGVDHGAAPRYLGSPPTGPGRSPRVGALVLCPDAAGLEDCAAAGSGRPERLRIVPAAHPQLASFLSRVTTGHRLCFLTTDDRRFAPPAQAGACFEIAEVGPGWLDVDVRRSAGTDEAPYPDALRAHAVAPLAAPQAAGERCFTTADVIAADGERVGQWVQFENLGEPGPPLVVSLAEDDVLPGVDRFCVAPLGGVPAGHPAGGRVWFGWGVEPGDDFWVDAPVVFESATGGDCDAVVRFRGNVSLRGASFRRQSAVEVSGLGTTLSGCERLWVYARRSPRGAQILFGDLSQVSCRWLAASTGGDRMPLCIGGGAPVDPDIHGIQCRDCGSLRLDDVASTFGVDDLVYVSGSPAQSVEGTRWNMGPMGAPAFSGQLLEAATPRVDLSDVACSRCSSCDGSGPLFFGGGAAAEWDVERLTALGSCGGLGSASRDPNLDVRDATLIDARPRGAVLLPHRLEGGVFRGARSAAGSAPLAAAGVEREDVVVSDHDVDAATLWVLAPGERMENVLLADLRCSARSGAGGCAAVADAAPADGVELRRTSVVATPSVAAPGLTHGLRLTAAPLGARVGALLFHGLAGPDAVAASDFVDAAAMSDPARFQWEDPVCHFANVPAGPAPDNAAAYGGAVIGVFADPELADPAAGDFEPVAGGVADATPCGIAGGLAGPGVRRRSWSLGLLGLEPEFVGGALTACGNGQDDDGDGFADAEDPGCSEARDLSERAPGAACDDGVDNDGDGFTDSTPDADGDGVPDPPGDPACASPLSPREGTQCQDGVDNDGAFGTDFDGGESILGPGAGDPDGPDPQCVGRPSRNSERPNRCGLGAELALPLAALAALRRRRVR
jgi:hypothetical protein